jgi:ribokinase
MRALLQVAAAAGVPVLLDAGGVDAPVPDELLQHLTIISPNETELQRLTGMPTDTDTQLLAAAAALQARVQPTSQQTAAPDQQPQRSLEVLLKLGTSGSMFVLSAAGRGSEEDDAADVLRQPAIKAPQVVDTTGESEQPCHALLSGLALNFSAVASSALQ